MTLDNFTDEELRCRYRFGRESIEFLSDLLANDLQRGETLKRGTAESPRVTLKRGMNMINNISMHFCMSFLPFSLGLFHYVVPVPLWFFVMILASFVPVPRFSVRHP